MKTVQLSLLASLLAVSPVIAGTIPAAANGVIQGQPPSVKPREIHRRGCNADNVLRDLRNPTRSVSASVFCSAYLQSTYSATTTVASPTTTTTTTTSTTTTTTTTTNTVDGSTETLLCAPSPTATLTCGYPAYGDSTYLISQTPNVDPVTCHQSCLQNPNCQSFQVESGGSQYCNLYNEPTQGYVFYAPEDVYTFYDRDCTNYLPPGCSASPTAKAKRQVATPSELTTYPPSRISSACSCFITSPLAPTTVVSTVQSAAVTITTTTTESTTTSTSIDTTIVTTTTYSVAAQ